MIPIEKIYKQARELGIPDFESVEKGNLIREIQKREGHEACFDAPWCNLCRKLDCAWGADCKSEGVGY